MRKSRACAVVFEGAVHPEFIAKPKEDDADERGKPRQQRNFIGAEDNEAGVVGDESDWDNESEDKAENGAEDCDGVFCVILYFIHEVENKKRVLNPKAGCCGGVLERNHNERRGYEKHDEFKQHKR